MGEKATGSDAEFARAGVLRFKRASTEAAFRDAYVLQYTLFYAFSALLGAVLYYVFFLWDQIIDPENAHVTHFIRGVIVPPFALAAALLIVLPATRARAELWITLLCLVSCCGLAVIYHQLDGGWAVGAVGFVLVFLYQSNLFRVRLAYNLAGMACAIVALNIGIALSESPSPDLWVVNNIAVVTGAFLAIVGAGYREHSARENFRLERALASARTKVGDLEYSLEHARGEARNETKVFISYRRSDSEAVAGRIRDRLAAHFGAQNVFMDIDNIPIGVDYRDHIRAVITRSTAMVLVIGDAWTGGRDDGSRRISDPTDPIAMELEIAFEERLPIMPILVGEAIMPSVQMLPPTLQRLSFLNAANVDPGRDFHMHLDRFIRALEELPSKT